MNLSLQTQDEFYNKLAAILANGQSTDAFAGDAAYGHSYQQVEDVHSFMYAEVQLRHASQGFQTLSEARKAIALNVDKLIAGDSIINPVTGLGTVMDPTMFTHATIPMMLGPMEMSGIYSNGGLAATIIDKKSSAMVGRGVTFKSFDVEFWTTEKIEMLEEAAENTGLNPKLIEAIRDSNIYGGSTIYPVFRRDTVKSFERPIDILHLEKDCIMRWVVCDRWNTVFVPSFNVTASDYLHPITVYYPLGGYAVHSSRNAILRARPMPYWAVMQNIGWSPSDFCGWIRTYLGYTVMQMAIPIMAQQMSLLLYQVPLDAMNATMGPKAVKELMAINEEKMKEWSILHPKMVNMVGELKIVDRTFSGFDNFMGAIKSDLAAQSEIPEPVLFHTPNKGFSDNTQEALLKESEMMKVRQRTTEVCLPPLTSAIVAHVFGQGSEEWKKRDTIHMSFDKPIISTEKDLAEIGARYAASIASLVQAEVPPHIAMAIEQQFFKNAKLDQEWMSEIEKEHKRIADLEEKMGERKAQGGGTGHTPASPGSAGNTGSQTKPGRAK